MASVSLTDLVKGSLAANSWVSSGHIKHHHHQEIKKKIQRNKYLTLFVLIIFIFSKLTIESYFTELAQLVKLGFYHLDYPRLCGFYTGLVLISTFDLTQSYLLPFVSGASLDETTKDHL